LFNRLKQDSFKPLFQIPKAAFSLPGRPVGLSLAVGAFIFGIGMQLASGCASGTLVGLGEGFVKSVIVIIFFILGATLAIQDRFYDWWTKWPMSKPVQIEWWITVVINFGLFAICFGIELSRYLKGQTGNGVAMYSLQGTKAMLLTGNNSTEAENRPGIEITKAKLYFVDVGIAVTVALWFASVGTTIGVMGAFSQIGSRIVGLCGGHPQRWKVWEGKLPPNLMAVPQVLSDASIVIGSLIATAIQGKFGATQKNGWQDMIRAVFGGLCMGVGGTLARGCNIGGMLSGITASAPSGFVWMVAAILGSGTVVGVDGLIERWRRTVFVIGTDILITA
jgi:uncharacterized membrane protein YedE/YeeE